MIKIGEDFFTEPLHWNVIYDGRDGIVGFNTVQYDQNIELRFFRRWGGYEEIPRPVGPISLMETTYNNRFYIGIFNNRGVNNYMVAFIKIDQDVLNKVGYKLENSFRFGYEKSSVFEQSNEISIFEKTIFWSFNDVFESSVRVIRDKNSMTEVNYLIRTGVERQLFTYNEAGILIDKKRID